MLSHAITHRHAITCHHMPSHPIPSHPVTPRHIPPHPVCRHASSTSRHTLSTRRRPSVLVQVFGLLVASPAIWRGESADLSEERMILVATMCAREGHEQVAIAVLRRALAPLALQSDGASSSTDASSAQAAEEGWRRAVGRWMIDRQLASPWPSAFAVLACSAERELAELVGGLVEKDSVFVGRRVLAFDEKARTWRQAAVNSIVGGEVDVTAGGWKRVGGLPLTKVRNGM